MHTLYNKKSEELQHDLRWKKQTFNAMEFGGIYVVRNHLIPNFIILIFL